MKNRDIKKLITDAYKSCTPDLSSKILSSCEKEPQIREDITEVCLPNQHTSKVNKIFPINRMIAAAACLILFLSGISTGMFISSDKTFGTDAEAFIYLDVNPSVELQIDSKNKIISCTAGNEDAEIILDNLNLNGVELNTALTTIVGSMYLNGYLSNNSNSMLVSVASNDDEKISGYLSDISNVINTIVEKSGLQCSIIAQGFKIDEDLEQRATSSGVSVGKVHLVDKMTSGFENLPLNFINSLLQLSIQDLNILYVQGKKEDDYQNQEIISGNVSVNITSDNAKSIVLNEMGKTPEDTEYIYTHMKICYKDAHGLVYIVKVKLLNDSTVYRYEVDCQTGDIKALE